MIAESVASILLEDEPSVRDIALSVLKTPRYRLQRASLLGGHFAVILSNGQTLGTIMQTERGGWTPYTIEVGGVLLGVGWSHTYNDKDDAVKDLWRQKLKHGQ